jgi:ribulose-phosphate 3-epimerase
VNASGTTGVRLAPSILSADFGHLADEVQAAVAGGADLVHLDVMDGHFVPNLTIGPAVVAAVRRVTDLPLDVHLMVTDPAAFIEPFRKAGADFLTVHQETVADPRPLFERIRALGAAPGLSINPATPLVAATGLLAAIDLLLVMTVQPGFGGQAFRDDVLPKVRQAAELKRQRGLDFALEVDGGVSTETAPRLVAAGAEILVAGSAVFGQGGATANLRRLRQAVSVARAGER